MTIFKYVVPDQNKLALIIGIDSYYHRGIEGSPSLPALLSCKKDAIDLYNLLSSGKLGYKIFGNGPIIGSDLDKSLGYTEINKSITNFFLDAEPGQTVLFYFSGHGIPWAGDVYLATPQTDPKRPSIAGFSLTSLARLMESSRSARIVCIIDACYSGAAKLPESKGIIDKDAAESDAVAANDTYSEILKIPKAEGKCLLLSSQAYERSRALNTDNSLYTKYVLEGMRGAKAAMDEKGRHVPASFDNNGNVTPESLHDYVYLKVANEAKQTPKIKSDKSSKIILAEYPQLAILKPTENELMLKLLQQGNVADFNNRRKEDVLKSLDLHIVGGVKSPPDLHFADLREANLTGANLTGANLTGAKLAGAKLAGANLTGANLRKADLAGANLTGANLTGADLPGAELIQTQLTRATLYGAILDGANLEGAKLDGAILDGASLEGANLMETNLEGAKLIQTNLTDASLDGANLRNAMMIGTDLRNVGLNEANLEGANLAEADLEGADLERANLERAYLKQTKNLPISTVESRSRGAII